MPADHFDGLDVKETVTELFEEVTRSESSNEVEETSKKVGVSRRGVEIVTQARERLRKGIENEFQKIHESPRLGILECGKNGR